MAKKELKKELIHHVDRYIHACGNKLCNVQKKEDSGKIYWLIFMSLDSIVEEFITEMVGLKTIVKDTKYSKLFDYQVYNVPESKDLIVFSVIID